jgi:hypothetical protein
MNAAELLDSVFDVYKKSFWPQMGLVMIAYVLLYAVLMILMLAGVLAMISTYIARDPFETAINDMMLAEMPFFLGTTLLIIFACALWVAFYQATVLIASRLALYEKAVDIGFVLKQVRRAFLRLCSVIAAESLVVIPFLALIGGVLAVVLAANHFSMQTFDIETLLVWSMWLNEPVNLILFSITFILIGLFFTLLFNCFALAIPAAVFQGKYFFGALLQSYRLIRGHFWKISGIRIIFLLVINSLSNSIWVIFALLIAGLRSMALSPVAMATFMNFATNVQLIVSVAIGLCCAPLPNILTALLYINQKIEKEGLDIDLGLSALESAALTQSAQVSDG